MLSVVLSVAFYLLSSLDLNVIMLSAIMLSVVASFLVILIFESLKLILF